MADSLARRIAVVGGGLAGIAAAVRLAEAGCRPILIESRRRLGGRATSLVDPQTGETIDNCQHVLMGCCTNLIDLYDRLGVIDAIEWNRTLHWTSGGGSVETLRAGLLPAPAHLAWSFARMPMFRAGGGRRHVARAMWRMIRSGAAGRQSWRERTFAEFLRECNQPPELVRSFWDVVVTSACNLGVDRVGAAHAIQVFQEGFLANRWSYTMGLSSVPLASLYDPAFAAIEGRGGEVLLGVSAKAIAYDGSRVSGVVTDDGTVDAAAVVSAVPFDRLDKLVSDTLRRADTRLAGLDRFGVSPILGVHLRFAEPVMDLPHLVLSGFGVQWLFNKGADEAGRQHVHAVISAADAWMDLDQEQIVERVMGDLTRALPGSKGLRPVHARCIKEKRATIALVPGVEALRPPVAPAPARGAAVKNLFLAGDWTDTGWPATMEGAVRSGYAAAAAITGEGGVVEDVPAGRLARFLGL